MSKDRSTNHQSSSNSDEEGLDEASGSSYVNIHGRPLNAIENEVGDIYIPLKELESTGFTIFHRDDFQPSCDKNKIGIDFHLYMLRKAREYILNNKADIDLDYALDTIEKCKEQVLETVPPSQNQVKDKSPGEIPNDLKNGNNQQQDEPSKTSADLGYNNSLLYPRLQKQPNAGLVQYPPSTESPISDGVELIKKNLGESSSFNDGKYFIHLFMKQVELEPLQLQKVKIVSIEKKGRGAWGVLVSNTHIAQKLYFDLNEQFDRMPVIEKPTSGTVAMALFKDVWWRVLVINAKPLYVQLVDRGVTYCVTCVRKLPRSCESIPAQAMRLVSPDVGDNEWVLGQIVTVIARKRYENGTYLVSIQSSQSKEKDDVKVIKDNKVMPPIGGAQVENTPKMDNPKSPTDFSAGTEVQLLQYKANDLFMRTKEDAEKFKNIFDHIQANSTDDLYDTPSLDFQVGQMVMAQRDASSPLILGEITKILDTTVHVKFIDVIGEADVSKIFVKNVDKFLTKQDVTLIKMELKNLDKYLQDKEVVKFLDKLVLEKENFFVTLDDGFGLFMKDGKTLSDVLETMFNDNLKKATGDKVPEQLPRIMYDKMKSVQLQLGENEYICYSYIAPKQITLLSLGDQEVEWLNIVGNIKVTDSEPYKPTEGEMCLALYKDPNNVEVSWCRGVVMGGGKHRYHILFVDFGNFAKVAANNIRRFPSYLQEIPILGVFCEIQDVPNNPAISCRLKQLLADSKRIIVDVKELGKFKAQIVIPGVMEELNNEAL